MFRKLFAVLAVVVGFAGAVSAGAVGGPGSSVQKCNANAANTHQITFQGGERAIVYFCGDGDTDLDIEVFDAAGNRVVFDLGPDDYGTVKWQVPRGPAAVYTVKITNLGNVWNKYVLTHN